jgi:ABC-type proline/glycine betaine transport system ATPase subunit
MSTAVRFNEVCIMFGPTPEPRAAADGCGPNREEIQAETTHVLGVHDCTLEVEEGEILVLMGLSGSGKSTLLRAVNGLNPVARGSVEVCRRRTAWSMSPMPTRDAAGAALKPRRDGVPAIRPAALAHGAGKRGPSGWNCRACPGRTATRGWTGNCRSSGLSDWAERKVGELSGGMQQRVGLARAFATEAPILLMDEPFSALDPLIRTKLQDELLDLQRDLKRTIIFVSHDLDEAFKIGNRIAIMEGGRIVQCGTPRDIFSAPASDAYVADFVANMNPLGRADRARRDAGGPMKTAQLLAGIAACTLACSGSSNAQELVGMAPDPDVAYSPYLQHDYPDQVLFGDTHLHTAYSADAGLMAATTTPDDAYRFAKGETVISSNGIPARLARPLDWLVVADHAENLGLVIALDEQSPVLEGNAWAAGLAEIFAPRDAAAMAQSYLYWAGGFSEEGGGGDPLAGTGLDTTMWQRITEAAERHNAPGAFTAFIGYEWTSGPGGNNLHRNVIFRDGKDLADRVVPFSAYDSEDPEDLWDWMARYETETGGQVLAIPHNGNLSNGLMFDDVTMAGEPLSADYATRRMRWEPVIRGHPDEGRRRGASDALARRRIRRLRHLGCGQLRSRAQDARDAAQGIRARGAEARPGL